MKKRTEFQEQFDERGSRTELGLQTSGICSEMKGEKLERKMLELRNMRNLAVRILRVSPALILKSIRLLAPWPPVNVAVVL